MKVVPTYRARAVPAGERRVNRGGGWRVRLVNAAALSWIAGSMMVAVAMLAPLASAQEPPARSREAQHAIAEMIARCTEDQRQFFATELTRPQYLVFCNCYVHSAIDAIDPDEQAYRREHDAPSPQFVETSRKLVAACIDQGRLRAPQ